jgi:DNA mismatch repair protein MutL
MMTEYHRIHVLPQDLANKIAAGEVVERPASVVKELLENAVDAQATRISVVTEAAGMKIIQVVDNGTGMSKDDLALAIIRHATSKIATDQDLKAIMTLGFRGEALPSIAAVSHMEIISRRADDLAGGRIYVEGGKVLNLEDAGAAVGTSVMVRHLFYNTPARKEFMRAAPAENAAISEMITRFSLAHPQIAFSLTSDGQKAFQSSGRNRLLDVITDVYGADLARKMIQINEKNNQYSLSGFIAPPQITRSNRKHILTFINSRWVKSSVLEDAVMEAYETLLPLHRFPICILTIQLNPMEIDVNVHPAKLEIRFHKEADIHDLVAGTIRSALLANELVPEVFVRRTAYPLPQQGEIAFQSLRENSQSTQLQSDQNHQRNMKGTDHDWATGEDRILDETTIQFSTNQTAQPCDLKILGQLLRTYILAERAGELFIIDQHAAEERTMYEKLAASISMKQPAQQIGVPLVVDLDLAEASVLEDYACILQEVGFSWEGASGRSVFLHEIPVGMRAEHAADLFRTILASVEQVQGRTSNDADKREKVMRAACRASVKANDILNTTEMQSLVQQLMTAENPYTCPHGRPTMLRFSQSELEKMFRRI